MIALGLDLGTNSVGSAWVDTDVREVSVGVSVFPAGVDEADDQRGAPKNQVRRSKRSLRRSLARRSERKRQTRRWLVQFGLLPADRNALRDLFKLDPWLLRERGLDERLSPHEFGRGLLHLGQRRGAMGLKLPDVDKSTTEESDEQAKVKAAVESTKKKMQQMGVKTFGQLMAEEMRRRTRPVLDDAGRPRTDAEGKPRTYQNEPIRNRLASFQFHADRSLIRDEFQRLWKRQSEPDGALAHLNEEQRSELLVALDNPARDAKWRHQGAIFGQRVTYWNTSTLGRCDLEPTDRCVPIADRHASHYRVLETVNNIRIQGPADRQPRPLNAEERAKVIQRLRTQKTGTVAAVRSALGIDKRTLKKQNRLEKSWWLNLESDEDREINTDWFHREIIGNVGVAEWDQWPENKKEGLNRAILKCDPAQEEDEVRLRGILQRMGIDNATCDGVIAAWKTRPKLEKRLSLSRGAILNLFPYMLDAFVHNKRDPGGEMKWSWHRDKQFNPGLHRWPTQIEARRMFADDASNGASESQRKRYRIGAQTLTKADRHYMRKHAGELPPAPKLSNPVVRKTIHEVRRHIIAHIRAHGGRKPDRIAIEFVREAKKSKKASDWILNLNRKRDRIRKQIIEEFVKPAWGSSFQTLRHNELQKAVDRVILARQQQERCAYSGEPISPFAAAKGEELEIDHIVPRAVGGNNAWSNRVLCWKTSNQNKRKQTPRQWWGNDFDRLSRPMAFMNGYEPAKGNPNEYFTKRDYAAKWLNFSREDVPQEWRGSQLTDTAYAARQVQSYLQSALWPDEPSHLEGGKRRIFVTIGSYTHQLRKDWQLFQQIIKPGEASSDEVQEASLKNRGDHREHAIDAVAIAFTAIPVNETLATDADGRARTRIDDLAHHQQAQEKEWQQARMERRNARGIKRIPLPVPWGDVKSFRHQVLSQVYGDFERRSDDMSDGEPSTPQPLVVSHRPVGRRILGAFHEETLFSPVPEMEDTYIGRKSVLQLTPAHLRMPFPEKPEDSVKRLAAEYIERGVAKSKRDARAAAKRVVESSSFVPPLVDPPPEKSGLIRDRDLRRRLRECIAAFEYTEKGRDGKVKKRYHLNSDNFTSKEIKQAVEAGAIKHASGVPIKRVKLLRTMKDPVVVHRKRWDHERNRWVRDTGKDGNLTADQRSRADRAYVGGNNHHIEIREDQRGKWTGLIVTMFEAARRIRRNGQEAVDRTEEAGKGGCFVMSLAEGETVHMKHKDTSEEGFFVVFKLDKPQTIHFKWHWDARKAKGEKDADGQLISGSKREGFSVTASQLKDLGPSGEPAPYKVHVTPLGEIQRIDD